jgi:hypothetical protein
MKEVQAYWQGMKKEDRLIRGILRGFELQRRKVLNMQFFDGFSDIPPVRSPVAGFCLRDPNASAAGARAIPAAAGRLAEQPRLPIPRCDLRCVSQLVGLTKRTCVR